MNKRKFIEGIKSIPRKMDDLVNYNARCNGGRSDLIKGLPNARPIDIETKKRIEDFWKPYLHTWKQKHAFDIRWFDMYNRTNVFGFDLAHYIPDGYYYAIVDKCLTNSLDARVLDDKNLYDLYFSDVNQPATIARKIKGVYMDRNYGIITDNEAIERCVANGAVIIKPSIDALGGRGIVFWREGRNTKEELRDALANAENVVVQDLIKQHKFLAGFTNSCVNTMRIITLLWDDEVTITSAVLIMGGPTAKTNHLHGGGIVCGILLDGKLRHTAFDGKLNEYKAHPNGQVFSEVTIPNYDKCIALVKRLAPRLSGIAKLLNWDITLDENGEPLLIEVNITWGGSVQIAGGPALGEKTVEVLDYVNKQGGWK